MKKILLPLYSLVLALCLNATETSMDSCYVYAQIEWTPAMTKYVGTFSAGHEKDFDELKDEKGEKIKFKSIISLMNYMSAKGWDYVQLYYPDGRSSRSSLQQRIVIRKKVSVTEAMELALPKE